MSPTKKPTPPTGIPTTDDEWEDTGVKDVGTLRAPSPAPYDATKATARKALAQIGELKKTFERFEERQYEHNQQILDRFEEHAKEDRVMFSKLGESMSQVREQNATQSVELRQIRHDLKNRQMIEIEEQKATAEVKAARQKTDIEDTAHQKKFRREFVLKSLSVLGPIFAALGGGLALLLRSCL